jgi:hypothetical protein
MYMYMYMKFILQCDQVVSQDVALVEKACRFCWVIFINYCVLFWCERMCVCNYVYLCIYCTHTHTHTHTHTYTTLFCWALFAASRRNILLSRSLISFACECVCVCVCVCVWTNIRWMRFSFLFTYLWRCLYILYASRPILTLSRSLLTLSRSLLTLSRSLLTHTVCL